LDGPNGSKSFKFPSTSSSYTIARSDCPCSN
jgi:hypothetical protein